MLRVLSAFLTVNLFLLNRACQRVVWFGELISRVRLYILPLQSRIRRLRAREWLRTRSCIWDRTPDHPSVHICGFPHNRSFYSAPQSQKLYLHETLSGTFSVFCITYCIWTQKSLCLNLTTILLRETWYLFLNQFWIPSCIVSWKTDIHIVNHKRTVILYQVSIWSYLAFFILYFKLLNMWSRLT